MGILTEVCIDGWVYWHMYVYVIDGYIVECRGRCSWVSKMISEVRGSNPRVVAYPNLSLPRKSSKLPGAGPMFPDWASGWQLTVVRSTSLEWPNQSAGKCRHHTVTSHARPVLQVAHSVIFLPLALPFRRAGRPDDDGGPGHAVPVGGDPRDAPAYISLSLYTYLSLSIYICICV